MSLNGSSGMSQIFAEIVSLWEGKMIIKEVEEEKMYIAHTKKVGTHRKLKVFQEIP